MTKTKKASSNELASQSDPWENRTPVTAVKGRCLSLLTNGPFVITDVYVFRLTRGRIELPLLP